MASASGVGGVLGGLLILRIRPSRPAVAAEIATAPLAAPLIMLAFRAAISPLAFSSLVLGAASAVLNVTVLSAVQESVPERLLARVNVLVAIVAAGSAPVGFALCGVFARLAGAQLVFACGGAVILLSVVALLSSRDIRAFTRIGTDLRERRGVGAPPQ